MNRFTARQYDRAAPQWRRILSGAWRRPIEAAQREVWLETYIFADDAAGQHGRGGAGRARRGAAWWCGVLVDGWGAKHYLTRVARARCCATAACSLLKYRPEVAPWQFRFHRLRRLHRKLCHVDRARRVRRRHQRHRRHEHAGAQAAARRLRGARARSAAGVDRAGHAAPVGAGRARAVRVAAMCRCFPDDIAVPRAGDANREVRDPRQPALSARHRARLPRRASAPPSARSSSRMPTSFPACASGRR